ncbi:hypothetical protein [Streptomyces sp. NBC_00564]|uniref:hypothetical protein n=1 Tax=Streptomyces sp. NBC_00564 TaxID=2903663 RepID=UPI00352BF617|nr:hypothetical protein OG256_04700 [Streptomyces sp. NBC_00564]
MRIKPSQKSETPSLRAEPDKDAEFAALHRQMRELEFERGILCGTAQYFVGETN